MLYGQFKIKAEAVSAEVFRFTTMETALDFILQFLQNEGMTDEAHARAVWTVCPCLTDTDRHLLSHNGIGFDITKESANNAKFGINQMEWALADTGSLAQNSTSIDQRLVSSLPTIHIAIVPTSGILPDMPTLLSKVHPGECAYLAIITGPSRTADIERVLTIGVHGPDRLVIVFVDEIEGGN